MSTPFINSFLSGGDPFAGNTPVLYHFNTTVANAPNPNYFPNSGTVSDATSKAELGANATLDTVNKLYGAGSCAQVGSATGGVNPNPDISAARLGSGAWAVEFSIRPSINMAGLNAQMLLWGAASPEIRITSGKLRFLGSGASPDITSSGSTFVANTWYQCAVFRSGGITYMYIDGVQVGSAVDGNNYNGDFQTIGFGASGNRFNGNWDELRITVGADRFSGGYVLPTAEFTPP